MDCVIWSFLNEHPAHKSRAGSGWLVEHVRAPRGRRRGRVEERATRTKDGRSRRETGSKGGWWGPARSVSGWGRAVTSQRKKKRRCRLPLAATRVGGLGPLVSRNGRPPHHRGEATTTTCRSWTLTRSLLSPSRGGGGCCPSGRASRGGWVGAFFFWSSGSSNRTSTAVAAAGAVPASVRSARHPSRAPEL